MKQMIKQQSNKQHDPLRDILLNMKEQIEVLLEPSTADEDGIDVRPMFNAARAQLVDEAANELKLAILTEHTQDVSRAIRLIEDAVEMRL